MVEGANTVTTQGSISSPTAEEVGQQPKVSWLRRLSDKLPIGVLRGRKKAPTGGGKQIQNREVVVEEPIDQGGKGTASPGLSRRIRRFLVSPFRMLHRRVVSRKSKKEEVTAKQKTVEEHNSASAQVQSGKIAHPGRRVEFSHFFQRMQDLCRKSMGEIEDLTEEEKARATKIRKAGRARISQSDGDYYLLGRACEQGQFLATSGLSSEDHAVIMYALIKDSAACYADAQYRSGCCFAKKEGSNASMANAFDCFVKAAKCGHLPAGKMVGELADANFVEGAVFEQRFGKDLMPCGWQNKTETPPT